MASSPWQKSLAGLGPAPQGCKLSTGRCGAGLRPAIFRFAGIANCVPGILLLWCMPAIADQPEQPVGLVLSAGGSKLQRLNAETSLAARAGDLLFAGDTV